MTVRFELTARLAELAGFREEPVELPESATLADAAACLVVRLREAGESRLLEGGRLHPSILALVDGHACRSGDPVPLTDGERIRLMLPVAGG